MSDTHTYSLRTRKPTAYADFFDEPELEETPRKRGLKRKRSDVDDLPKEGQRITTSAVKNDDVLTPETLAAPPTKPNETPTSSSKEGHITETSTPTKAETPNTTASTPVEPTDNNCTQQPLSLSPELHDKVQTKLRAKLLDEYMQHKEACTEEVRSTAIKDIQLRLWSKLVTKLQPGAVTTGQFQVPCSKSEFFVHLFDAIYQPDEDETEEDRDERVWEYHIEFDYIEPQNALGEDPKESDCEETFVAKHLDENNYKTIFVVPFPGNEAIMKTLFGSHFTEKVSYPSRGFALLNWRQPGDDNGWVIAYDFEASTLILVYKFFHMSGPIETFPDDPWEDGGEILGSRLCLF